MVVGCVGGRWLDPLRLCARKYYVRVLWTLYVRLDCKLESILIITNQPIDHHHPPKRLSARSLSLSVCTRWDNDYSAHGRRKRLNTQACKRTHATWRVRVYLARAAANYISPSPRCCRRRRRRQPEPRLALPRGRARACVSKSEFANAMAILRPATTTTTGHA